MHSKWSRRNGFNLYKEKTVVKRNIAEENALDELVELIKEYGDWVDTSN